MDMASAKQPGALPGQLRCSSAEMSQVRWKFPRKVAELRPGVAPFCSPKERCRLSYVKHLLWQKGTFKSQI